MKYLFDTNIKKYMYICIFFIMHENLRVKSLKIRKMNLKFSLFRDGGHNSISTEQLETPPPYVQVNNNSNIKSQRIPFSRIWKWALISGQRFLKFSILGWMKNFQECWGRISSCEKAMGISELRERL